MAYPNPTQPVVINVSTSVTPQADTRLRTFAVVSCGDTSLSAGESVVVSADNYTSSVTASTTTAYFLASFFAQASNKTCTIVEVKGSGSPAVSAQVNTLMDFISAGIGTAYAYYLPSTLVADTSVQSLFTAYGALNQSTYFFIDMENKEPTSSTQWTTNVNGAKSVFGSFPNIATSNIIPSGVSMGICASSSYDITSANKLLSLNGKICSGIASTSIDTALQQAIADAPATFFYNVGTTCYLGGGRMADGELWTTRYAWDLTISKVTSAIQTALLNASNIANTAIYFDNNGITTLAQVIINTLNTCVSYGLLSTFGSGKDLSTGAITGQGVISAIDAATWEAQNPTEYAQGIYGGFSAYLKVQNFIQQVIFNVAKA